MNFGERRLMAGDALSSRPAIAAARGNVTGRCSLAFGLRVEKRGLSAGLEDAHLMVDGGGSGGGGGSLDGPL